MLPRGFGGRRIGAVFYCPIRRVGARSGFTIASFVARYPIMTPIRPQVNLRIVETVGFRYDFLMKLCRAVFVFWCVVVGFVYSQNDDNSMVEGPSDEFQYHLSIGFPLPNVELPAHIEAEDGKLTFYADFDHSDEHGIPIYLINRTKETKALSAQDRDIYVRLEFQSEEGQWVRAQTHRDSWCGNSYNSVNLPPGQHFRFTGYRPKDGKKVKVRYVSRFHELVSEVGEGFILNADVEASAFDDMAAREIGGLFGSLLRVGNQLPFGFERTPLDYVSALRLLSEYTESKYYRKEAEEMMRELGRESEEAKQIQDLLNKKWPSPRISEEEFLSLCLENIESGDHPHLAWMILSRRGRYGNREDGNVSGPLMKRLANLLPESLQSKDELVTKNAVEMLEIPGLVDEHFSTETLTGWLDFDSQAVFAAAARKLALRLQFGPLVKKGLELKDKERRYVLLGVLASGGKTNDPRLYPRGPETKEEREFWNRCLTEDPVRAVSSLPGTRGEWNLYNRIVQGPLKDYLENLGENMSDKPVKVEQQDLFGLSHLVEFFGTWKMKENVPVLQALLAHPEYSEGEVYSSKDGRYLHRDYRIRRVARDALFKMMIPVDPDLVYEEKISLPDKPAEPAKSAGDDPFGF